MPTAPRRCSCDILRRVDQHVPPVASYVVVRKTSAPEEQRLWVLDQFRQGKLRLLVATDVLGRGRRRLARFARFARGHRTHLLCGDLINYTFTNYNFNKPLIFKQNMESHPSGGRGGTADPRRSPTAPSRCFSEIRPPPRQSGPRPGDLSGLSVPGERDLSLRAFATKQFTDVRHRHPRRLARRCLRRGLSCRTKQGFIKAHEAHRSRV